MKTELYNLQNTRWPQSGKHVMAQFNDDSIIVYQAYRPSIADYAVEHQKFGGDFKYTRMSWIKPNFLWMMYRAGWAEKQGQERILAIHLNRSFFDELTEEAIASSFRASSFESIDDWKRRVAQSDVRLQWDPDHDPHGNKLDRRAVQLGLRGHMLERFGTQEIQQIEDVTEFVSEQRSNVVNPYDHLDIPSEEVYPLTKEAIINLKADEYRR